jgi:hypothetical protein
LKYLPSKKFILLVVALGIVGGMIFFATGGNSLFKSTVFDRGTNDASNNTGIVVVPGEGDAQLQGNWQDTLNKIVPSGSGTGNDAENITSKIASGIIEKVPQLQSQSDGSIGDQSTQDIVNSVVKSLPEGTPAVVHTLKELSVISDSSTPALKTYGDALANIFAIYSKKLADVGYEIVIVEKAINTNDGSELMKLPVIEGLYKNMIHDLMAIKTPKDTEKTHLNIINAYELAVSSIHDMESVISDPAKGLVGISRYRAVSQVIQESILNLNSLFKTRGVVLENGNTGFMFSPTASQ